MYFYTAIETLIVIISDILDENPFNSILLPNSQVSFILGNYSTTLHSCRDLMLFGNF